MYIDISQCFCWLYTAVLSTQPLLLLYSALSCSAPLYTIYIYMYTIIYMYTGIVMPSVACPSRFVPLPLCTTLYHRLLCNVLGTVEPERNSPQCKYIAADAATNRPPSDSIATATRRSTILYTIQLLYIYISFSDASTTAAPRVNSRDVLGSSRV